MKIETIHYENGNDKSLWAAYKERLIGDLVFMLDLNDWQCFLKKKFVGTG